MPSARPILFTAPMVRALLDGTKTQTRRLIKRPTDHFHASCVTPKWQDNRFWWFDDRGQLWRELKCPYGQPGDLLWVRETCVYDWAGATPRWRYRADEASVIAKFPIERPQPYRWPRGVVPSIHMPKTASRLTLRLTEIRAQRLQDIGEADAIAEGVTKVRDHCYVIRGFDYDEAGLCHSSAITPYAKLWDSINAADGIRWEDNPWVWALTFTVHESNVDTVLAEAAAPAMETA